ncbi:flagellar assembly protein FliW [Bryobacter aggregatus]|uniref:flagellar assembly protein FliW n=1 Tax=Bryobacter aggregatus TaxID=360054 RepID=UPI0009B5B093|nr:flagellar assembly protein FliW [Bryobacter aggregatus]
MRSIESARFGMIRFEDREIIEFPAGLPGFEEQHQFLLIEAEESVPLKFLQCVGKPGLSFVCAPLSLVDPDYEGVLPRADRELLAMPGEGIAPGTRLEWLVILCFGCPELPTANLLGPLVIRRDVGLGVQSIREDSRYSARQPLFAAEPALCS